MTEILTEGIQKYQKDRSVVRFGACYKTIVNGESV